MSANRRRDFGFFSSERQLILQVLHEKRPELCRDLTPKDHYPHLRSQYVLSRDDEEEIEQQGVTTQKVHKMLDILTTKGAGGFDGLVASLIKEKTQIFLAEELNKAYEEKRKRLRMLLQTQQNSPRNSGDNSILPSMQSGQPDLTALMNQAGDRSSISDLGVDTDKLPKPVMIPADGLMSLTPSDREMKAVSKDKLISDGSTKMAETSDMESDSVNKLSEDMSKQGKFVQEHEDESTELNIRQSTGESKA